MDLSLERAAADLYATPWMTFRRVTLPLMVPGIMAGACWPSSSRSTTCDHRVRQVGRQDTLPTYMLGQLRRAITPGDERHRHRVPGAVGDAVTAFFL
jgi:spermidine/putrescine transport system permease protein